MKKYYYLFRIKHYFKNFIIFTPILFVENNINYLSISELIKVFFVFCLVASLVYIYNDILDINSDKKHPRKKNIKPIANGQILTNEAYNIIILLILFISLILYFNQNLISIVMAYIIINYLYSNYFKKIIILDIFVLSSNYLIRVIAGCIGLGVPLSIWMGATIFSGALFLSAIKRKQELFLYGTKSRNVLKFYSIKGLKLFSTFAALSSILFYTSYVITVNQKLLLTVPLVIYGIFRYNYLSNSRNFTDSPIDEIINDKQNIVLIFVWMIIVIFERLN